MNKITADFIRSKKIDSLPKLNLLLYLHKNSKVQGGEACLAAQLYLGDVQLVEKLVQELADREVIVNTGRQVKLADAPDIKKPLQHLAKFYEHPLTRQGILAQIQIGDRYGPN